MKRISGRSKIYLHIVQSFVIPIILLVGFFVYISVAFAGAPNTCMANGSGCFDSTGKFIPHVANNSFNGTQNSVDSNEQSSLVQILSQKMQELFGGMANSLGNLIGDDKNKTPDATNPQNSQPNGAQNPNLQTLLVDSSEANIEKCVLVTPGISHKLGNMYGEIGTRANNDKHEYLLDIVNSGKCTVKDIKREIVTSRGNSNQAPAFDNISPIPAEKCVFAVDYKGIAAVDHAVSSSEGIGKEAGNESDDNFKIRSKQAAENNDETFAVTTDEDITRLKKSGADSEIRKNKAEYKGKSNQTIDVDAAAKGGGKIVSGQPYIPDDVQHKHFWLEPGNRTYQVPNPAGSTLGKEMRPNFFPAGGKTSSANAGGNVDVKVTEDCKYNKNDDKAPEPPKPDKDPFKDPGKTDPPKIPDNPGGQQNPGSDQQNPGGSQNPGGGQGGQGNNNQNGQPTSTPYPYYPSPTPPYGVACLQNYAPVCDVYGQTQANRCIAEQQRRVQVAHDGECVSNGSVVCPKDYIPVCDENNQTQPNQCVAEQQEKVKIKHTGVCAGTDTTNSSDNVTALAALIKQVVTSGMPESTITNVIQSIITLFSEYINGTSSVNSSVSVQ